jgi:methenyltetrahydrofolate cyclohydrolase
VHDHSLDSFLDALASGDPEPGGGAAAALQVALGAALVGMVCELTLGRERYRDAWPLMREVSERVGTLRAVARALVDRDATAFGKVSEAYRLPKDTDDQRAERAERIEVALRGAAEVPLETAATAAEVLTLAERSMEGSNPTVRSDIGVAVLAARGGLDAGALNVRVNLALMRDTAYAEEVERRLSALVGPAREQAGRVLASIEGSVERVAT